MTFDPSCHAPIKNTWTQFQTALTYTQIHIVEAWNMSLVKECSPLDFRLHNGLCCDTLTLSHTFMGGLGNMLSLHYCYYIFEVPVGIYLNLKNHLFEPGACTYTSSDPIWTWKKKFSYHQQLKTLLSALQITDMLERPEQPEHYL